MRLVFLPILAALLPAAAIYGAYSINVLLGAVDICFPNYHGCISVSRGARAGDGLFLFRFLMMPYAVVLMIFWVVCRRWLRALGDTHEKRLTVMVSLGVLGAFALLAYTTFLGSEGDFYRFVRKYGVIFFFAFTGFSQMMLVSRLYALTHPVVLRLIKVRHFMLAVCVSQVVLAFWHTYIEVFVRIRSLYNANEWNFGILLILFPLGLYVAWKETGISWSVSTEEK